MVEQLLVDRSSIRRLRYNQRSAEYRRGRRSSRGSPPVLASSTNHDRHIKSFTLSPIWDCTFCDFHHSIEQPQFLASTSSNKRPLCSPLLTMRPASTSAGAALRNWTRHPLPTSPSSSSRLAAASATTASSPNSQRRLQSNEPNAVASSSFHSPFTAHRAPDKKDTTQIPSFKAYASPRSEVTNRVFQYFMAGSMGLLAAAGAKNTVQGMQTTSMSFCGQL